MFNQEKPTASANHSNACEPTQTPYCFDVEAVNKFFSVTISVEAFAKFMRAYNNEVSLTYMALSDKESEEPIPNEVVKGAIYLNKFLETLHPFFSNL